MLQNGKAQIYNRIPLRACASLSSILISSGRDSSLTLAKNYQKLGLTARLKARTGGTEKTVSQHDGATTEAVGEGDSLSMPDGKAAAAAEARVERDPESGAIVRTMPSESRLRNPLNDLLNDLSDEEQLATGGSTRNRGIIRQLEEDAARPSKRRKHPQSAWETEWALKLVSKYGMDYARMARDRKLNPYQRTEADIRKRVARSQIDSFDHAIQDT